MSSEIFFITGKGGTGKSTFSSLLSVYFAGQKLRTLLVSLDRAHSLSDIFEVNDLSEALNVNDFLCVWEPDVESVVTAHTQRAKARVKQNFRYLAGYALESLIDLVSISPGAEEQALWEVLHEKLISGQYDIIIMDAPPSGQAVRILSLPFVMAKWMKTAANLKKEIEQTEQAEKNILGEKEGRELSGIFSEKAKEYEILLNLLNTVFHVISITDGSFLGDSEINYIKENLIKLNLNLFFTVFNNKNDYSNSDSRVNIDASMPFLENFISGYKKLSEYSLKNKGVFEAIRSRL